MIDIQRLETFLCVAEKLNISEAAKQLHLSQPTVSHQIKLLEKELSATLFTRSNTGLQLANCLTSPTRISALQMISFASPFEKRLFCISRAALTLCRIDSDDSPKRFPLSFS